MLFLENNDQAPWVRAVRSASLNTREAVYSIGWGGGGGGGAELSD